MTRKSYILKENKGLMKVLRRLFATTNQPYIPRLKVLCRFYRSDSSVFERMIEVERPEWRFESVVANGIVVGKKLVIGEGYITLHDKQERYLAVGSPPFSYLFNDPLPCPSWMLKMLEEDSRC